MQPKKNIIDQSNANTEVVVGVFHDLEHASQATASLRGPGIEFQRISKTNVAAHDNLPEIPCDQATEQKQSSSLKGALYGSALGALASTLFISVPGINVLCFLLSIAVGGWIGAIAGLDETLRSIGTPKKDDYQRVVDEGKSVVVFAGKPKERARIGQELMAYGALEVHHHPPVGNWVQS